MRNINYHFTGNKLNFTYNIIEYSNCTYNFHLLLLMTNISFIKRKMKKKIKAHKISTNFNDTLIYIYILMLITIIIIFNCVEQINNS